MSGGSGVLAGSIADTVTGTLTRQLTRTMNFGINGGYSRNKALAIPGFAVSNQNYNYWFGGREPQPSLGPHVESVSCRIRCNTRLPIVRFALGASCSTSFVRHLISVGLSWQSRPMLF